METADCIVVPCKSQSEEKEMYLWHFHVVSSDCDKLWCGGRVNNTQLCKGFFNLKASCFFTLMYICCFDLSVHVVFILNLDLYSIEPTSR